MKGGHNRRPTAQKELEGTLRPDRSNPLEPAPAPCRVPRPPKGLSDVERAVWRQLACEVKELGVYSVSDGTGFRLLVRAVALAEGAGPDMAPTARVRLLQVAAGLLASFGLTPASRGRVATAPPVDRAAADLFGIRGVVAGGRP
jgi:hypothetical protein